MVTKGEIQSIDYQGNTCVVRLPYFESAGVKDNIQATATVGNQPGLYNGYKVGDVVYVAFEDGEANHPVIIGKLFLGSDKERNDPRGVVNAESSIISNNIELPITTKIVYETDGTVAQNGNTRYNSISDITNELGKLTAQQDKTTYDVTGVITTANMLKSEISAVKAGSGNKNTYAQETKPADETYTAVTSEEQEKLTETSNYVGYYVLVDGKYEAVTNENKDSLSIYPPYTKAYKLQKLEQGDLWVYTGKDIFEKIGTKEKAADYIGTYVYYKGDAITTDAPISAECPDCEKADFFKAAEGYSFKFIDASNYASILTSAPTSAQAYKKHLANNATFSYDGKRWNNATSSDVIAYGSAIIQTASSVSAKVNKTHLDGTNTDFGWQLHEQIDGEDTSITGTRKPGDSDGQFTVYSRITKKSGEQEVKEAKDVLHINKNGMWVNGNLEVEDSEGQKIFRALPYGEYTKNGEDELIYNGSPKVEIGGFTADKTTLINENIGFRVGSTGLSITNSGKDQFSVLSDGTIWGKKLYIEQDEKHESGSASYFDGNVCGHQMKVDTVELATTNTGNGNEQTAGFRVEKYKVQGSGDNGEVVTNENGEYELYFSIASVNNSRDSSGNYTNSDKSVACVLSNKAIGASIKITYKTSTNEKKYATFSINGTLLGYPYNADGSVTDAQKKYLWDSATKAFKGMQSDPLVKIKIVNGQICSATRSIKNSKYDSWSDYTVISALSKITDCESITEFAIISWTPQKEEYFTGDFLASTGFFKDKNCCFLEGAIVDVFSLPWARRLALSGSSVLAYAEDNVLIPAQILEVQVTSGSMTTSYYYAYKELRKGDVCTIGTGDVVSPTYVYNYLEGNIAKGYKLAVSEPYVLFSEKKCTPKEGETYISYDQIAESFSEVLPALNDFTMLNTVNASIIRKYLTADTTSLGLNWYNNKSLSQIVGDIDQNIYPSNCSSYTINAYEYGANITSTTTAGILPIILYSANGVKISFCVDNVGLTMNDGSVEEDKIFVFCSRPLYVYESTGTSSSSTPLKNAFYSYKFQITPVSSDILSILMYGSNAAIKCDIRTGEISQNVGTQLSNAYLRTTNSTIMKSASNQSVIGQNISTSGSSIKIKIDNRTDITPPTPIIVPTDKWVVSD